MMNNTITEVVPKKNEECIELKNIKYKTFMKGKPIIKNIETGDICVLEKYLENENTTNKSESWHKLDNTNKTFIILKFINVYSNENNFSNEEKILLNTFLIDCLDRKKLQRVKDVEYNKTTQTIQSIPSLIYNKQNKHFTLKNTDKHRVSTLKSLPIKK